MMQSTTLSQRIEALRQGTMAVLERLVEQGQAWQLPSPATELAMYREKLLANDYQVLVAGEAKHGKSTFVNALIGQHILPTDVDVATSQVFRISRATDEAYRLRFEDDSSKAITRAELPLYGSQVQADASGLPALDQVIRWIEVDLPTSFLPEGVRLLDTPGLGSLYAAHARITQRFVPLADAVIFVLDSQRPIIQPEIDFIQTILQKTPHLFFIQTKIDLYRRDHWQMILQRNQEILAQHFATRLTNTRVWPISSSNLLKARQEEDGDDYLRTSRYTQLAAVLQIFLFHVAGWDRAAAALRAAEDYFIMARRTLAGRLATITEESAHKREDVQRRIALRTQQFESEWGTYGQKREELLEQVRQVARTGKQLFLQEFQPGGAIETAQRANIDALTSVQEARHYSTLLDEQVSEAFLTRWKQIHQDVFLQWSALLGPFLAAANALSFAEDTARVLVRHARKLQVKPDWAGIIDQADKESAWVSTLLGLFLPGTVANLAALFWAGVRTWFIGTTALLENARLQLHQHLDDVLHMVQQQYLGLDLRYGYHNHVDGFFDARVHSLCEQIHRLVALKSAEAQREIERLAEESRMDEQARKTTSRRIQQELDAWDAIFQELQKVVFGLEGLDLSTALLAENER
jgi:GTPase SAR1 family protein